MNAHPFAAPMTPWLLVDYGGVISRPFDDRSYRDLAALLGVDVEHVRATYWQHRRTYDAGDAPQMYWSRVAGHDVSAELAARVDAVDVAGWGHTEPAVLALLAEQRSAGKRLALLSNAPHSQAGAYDRADWAPLFEHLFTSCRLGVAKPDPAIFARALETLGAAAIDVTFVDDRPENVAAATGLGMRAIRFTGVDGLRREFAPGG